jgi:hypothetical protein
MVGVALFEWCVVVHWNGGQIWHLVSSLKPLLAGECVIVQSTQSKVLMTTLHGKSHLLQKLMSSMLKSPCCIVRAPFVAVAVQRPKPHTIHAVACIKHTLIAGR